MSLSRKQFGPLSYRYTENDGERVVNAMHPDKGIVAHLAAGPNPEQGWGYGLSTTLAYVHPEFRRQGVATTMFNIMSHQLGYTPTQDRVRTKMGDAWAKSTGAPLPNRIPMSDWDISASQAEESLPEKQMGNWMRGEKIDPTVAKALTPVKPKRKRSVKNEQLQMEL